MDFSILELYENNKTKLFAARGEDIKAYFDKFYTDIIEYSFNNGILSRKIVTSRLAVSVMGTTWGNIFH